MDSKSEWKSVQLGELLTDDQIQMVKEIMDQTPDELERTHAIRKYLNQFKEQLEARGVIPDYLAYVIVYKMKPGSTNGKH